MARSTFSKLLEFHVEEIRPYLAARDRKPLFTQLREAVALYRRYRYPPYQYLRAGLYLKSAPEHIGNYMPFRLLKTLRESLNPMEARILAQDKLRFRKQMEAAGLPVLREVFSVDRVGVIRNAAGKVFETGAAVERLQGGKFFVKPICGRFGVGARLLQPEDDAQLFLKAARNVIVQPCLLQHPLLQSIYPHAVNSVRIDTLQISTGWVSNAAVLKLGRGGNIVDNSFSGGLTVGIDLESGALQPIGRQKSKFSTSVYYLHPDTGKTFEGIVLPHWAMLRETVVQAAKAMLPLKSLGWDVAITEDGVVLLEANDSWDIQLLQGGRIGLGDTELGRMAREFHGLKEPRGSADERP